ncbi:MAG: autotransporter-associated beta strand repeat-containing protein, partial [Thermoguttaceae bacterium]|nr:autotransporter-associated beta strand repeat-containing protein [Thermoguttaceae bacterium]
GLKVASESGVSYVPNTTNAFFIGMGGDTGTEFPFHGLVDEVAVYGRALAPAAVNRHFLVASTGAEVIHWVGGADLDWGTGSNWHSSGSPAEKIVVFGNAGASQTAGAVTNTVNASYTVASILYENTANHHTTVIGAGNTLTLAADSETPRIFVAGSARIDGQLGGSQGMIKTGDSTLTLGGTGAVPAMAIGGTGVTVAEGTLRLARSGLDFNTGVFTAGTPLKVESGATLEVGGTWNLRHSNVVTVDGGTLRFTAGSAGDSANYLNNMILHNAMVVGNGIRIGNDSHALFTITGDAGTTISTPLVMVNSGGSPRTLTLDVADGVAEHDLILSGRISDYTARGPNRIAKAGDGTLLLSGDNNFTGTVAIDGGLLLVGHQNALGAQANAVTFANAAGATLSLGGFDVSIGSLAGGGTTGGEVALGDKTLTVGFAGTSTTYAGAISGAGGLVKTGSGILTLSGPLNHTGNTVVDGGVLVLNMSGAVIAGNTGQFGSAGHTITVNSGATLRTGQSWALGDGGQHYLIANGGTIHFQATNYQSNIALTGAAITTNGTTWRTGYHGGDALITVNESDVSSTIDGSIVFVRTTSGSPGSGPPGKTTFHVANGAAEYDLIVSSVIRDYSDALNGMKLVKDGPGTMVLNGASIFIGGVDVDAGTLLVNNTSGSGTGTGPVAVNGGGTLGGTGTIAGATTITAGGTLATGTSIGTLTFGNNLTLEDGAIWNWEFINNIDGNYDQADGPNLILPTEGTVTLNIWGLEGHSVGWYDEFTIFTGDMENFSAGLFQLENFSDWTRGWRVSVGNSLVLTAVPEPGTWLLLLLALMGGLLVRRR